MISNLYSFPYLCFKSLKYQCSHYFCKAFHLEHLPSNCNLQKSYFLKYGFYFRKIQTIKVKISNFYNFCVYRILYGDLQHHYTHIFDLVAILHCLITCPRQIRYAEFKFYVCFLIYLMNVKCLS